MVAAATVAALAGCGSGGSSTGHSTPGAGTQGTPTTASPSAPKPLTIFPRRAGPRSDIRFSFTAPIATGRHGANRISYSLSVAGVGGPRCLGAHEATAGPARQGQRVTIVDDASSSGRLRCPGRYTARVFELARAACPAGQRCPQSVRVQATVATGAFVVRGG